MKRTKSQQLLEILRKEGAKRPSELADLLEISPQATHRNLSKLLDKGEIKKKGKAPLVLYEIADVKKHIDLRRVDREAIDCIEEKFSFLSSTGVLKRGSTAFSTWLQSTSQVKAANSLALAYLKLHREIYPLKKQGLFDISEKLETTFSETALQKVYCSDFYSLPQFGKTHLGNLITAGKSGQNKEAIREIAKLIQEDLLQLIEDKKIDVIAWTPHSIARKLLFLPYLKQRLNLALPEMNLVKAYSGNIPIAQKSLSKLQDRIDNARETIHLSTRASKAKSVLIIDDALGSGATINESAKKIRKQLGIKKIYAYAIVGSYKGFDVLSVV